MEIPARLFVLFWALIGPISLSLGFYTLDKTDLSNSVSPLVISFFKLVLTSILFMSLFFCIIRCKQLNYHLYTPSSYIWTGGVGVISALYPGLWTSSSYIEMGYFSIKMMWLFSLLDRLPNMNTLTIEYPTLLGMSNIPAHFFPRYTLMILPAYNLLLIGRAYYTNPPRDARLAFQTAVETSLFLVSQTDESSLESGLMFLSMYIFAIYYTIEAEIMVGVFIAEMKEKKLANFFEFAVGTMGALLFQNSFRLTSFNQVAGFLYLAVAWLAILALLRAPFDFGVLNFLLGNVLVGCTVSQLGLCGTTWLAYAASLLLYGLRLRLESLTVVHRPNQLPQVVLW